MQLGCALLLLFVGGMLLLFLIDDNRHGLLSLSVLDAMYVVDQLLHLNRIYRFHIRVNDSLVINVLVSCVVVKRNDSWCLIVLGPREQIIYVMFYPVSQNL